MRKCRALVPIVTLIAFGLTAVVPMAADAYTGAGLVQATKIGQFVAKPYPGTRQGIQDALDWVGAGAGGSVLVASGIYDLDSTLWVHGNTRLGGHGQGRTILRRSALNASGPANSGHLLISAKAGFHSGNIGLTGGLPTDSLTSIEVCDLTLDGNRDAWPDLNPNTPGNMGLQFWFVDGVTIRNVEIKNTLQTGLELDACRNSLVTGCRFERVGQQKQLGSRNGININNNSGSLNASVNWARQTRLDDLVIKNQRDAAIDIANNSEVTITNVTMLNDSIPTMDGNFSFEHEGDVAGYTAHDFTISNVISTGLRGSFYRLSPSANHHIERLSIKNCIATFGANTTNNAGEALMLGRTTNTYVKTLLIDQCIFSNINVGASTSGAKFADLGWGGTTPSSDVTISNTSFYGANGGTRNASNPGVFIYGNVYDITLDNVRVYGAEDVGIFVTPGSAAYQQHGIRIMNCIVDGAQSAGYLFGSNSVAAPLNGLIVENNIAKDTDKFAAGPVFDLVGSVNGSVIKNVVLRGNRALRTSGTNMQTGLRVFQSGTVVMDSVAALDNDFGSVSGAPYLTSGAPTNLWWRDARGLTFANLPAVASNGSQLFCTNCTKATPCAAAGTGAYATRQNGAWDCNP